MWRKIRRFWWGLRALLARWGIALPGKVMYIGGSDTLPPPLKREEEAALILRLSEGDEESKSTLIERNLRLVVYIAKRFENTGINIEDLISIGTNTLQYRVRRLLEILELGRCGPFQEEFLVRLLLEHHKRKQSRQALE